MILLNNKKLESVDFVNKTLIQSIKIYHYQYKMYVKNRIVKKELNKYAKNHIPVDMLFIIKIFSILSKVLCWFS